MLTFDSVVDDMERDAPRRRELWLPDIHVQIPHPPIPGVKSTTTQPIREQEPSLAESC
jgi:hypothetical protein